MSGWDELDLIPQVGNPRGMLRAKENRAARLIARWSELQDKFERMIFAGKGCSKRARMAYATLLMMETGIRIGNESSAEGFVCDNQKIAQKDSKDGKYKAGDIIWQHPNHGQTVQTFGLTTLQNQHIQIKRNHIDISFIGKKIVQQNLRVTHPTLIQFAPKSKARNDLWLGIDYYNLKKFIKKSVGHQFSPKDLRTAKVNLIFVSRFGNDPHKSDYAGATSKSARKKVLSAAIEETANIIGHTKSVCRGSYLSAPMLSWIVAS